MLEENYIIIKKDSHISNTSILGLKKSLTRITPNIKVVSEKSRVTGAWEWIIPAAIVIYIGKSFIEGFLNELGAESVRFFKKTLFELFKEVKQKEIRNINISEAKKLLDKYEKLKTKGLKEDWQTYISKHKPGKPIPSISFNFDDDKTHFKFRFVFPAELSKANFIDAFKKLPAIISEAKTYASKCYQFEIRHKRIKKNDFNKYHKMILKKELCSDRTFIYAYDKKKSNWINVSLLKQNETRDYLIEKGLFI